MVNLEVAMKKRKKWNLLKEEKYQNPISIRKNTFAKINLQS